MMATTVGLWYRTLANLQNMVKSLHDELSAIVPFIAENALKAQDYFDNGVVDCLESNQNKEIVFNSGQILTILSLGFFCCIPPSKSDEWTHPPNFIEWYQQANAVHTQKLLFMLNYFKMMQSEAPDHDITI